MIEAPKCPETGLAMSRGVRPMEIAYKGARRTIEMPGWYCEDSGESIHTSSDLKVSDAALHDLKAEVEHLASPDEVRRIRKRLKLTQTEAGRLIGGGIRAFQKYESGEVLASRPMTTLLRLLERHPEEIERLRAEAPEGTSS